MRQALLNEGAKELSYEIRGIVKKAAELEKLGVAIRWENIGDPVQKNAVIPEWIKDIITHLASQESSYKYCHSKGVLATRTFLAQKTNSLGGVQITEEDILFFNGSGDAIAKLYQYLAPTSRVIGPSPAYSTHSSAEAAHANHQPLVYQLNPNNHWYPDLDDLYLQVKYNPNIVGILIINPDNPTGMVYPLETLQRIVAIAREFKLFLISDEAYTYITYNGAKAYSLAEIIEDVPGIAIKSISKEVPWPGARCGWAEFYNRHKDAEFNRFCSAIENAKMLEVCATTLPQLAIPYIYSNPQFLAYRKNENEKIGIRSKIVAEILADVPTIYFNPTNGAFFNTIIFKEEALKETHSLQPIDSKAGELLKTWLQQEKNISTDRRFVYELLCSKGICVVPISSFCSSLQGFRITLLEENETELRRTFEDIREAILAFTGCYVLTNSALGK
jgi:aspartate/methionine/tyrosine aminotransferase